MAAATGEQGYPADDRVQVLAGLLAGHVSAVTRYRAAKGITAGAASRAAAAGDLRQAMIGYRALFRDLLGEPAETQAAEPEPGACCGPIPPMDTRAAAG